MMLSSERIFIFLDHFPQPSSAAPSVSMSDSSSEMYVQNFESYMNIYVWMWMYIEYPNMYTDFCKYTKCTDYKLWDHELRRYNLDRGGGEGERRGAPSPPPPGKMLNTTLNRFMSLGYGNYAYTHQPSNTQ